MRELNELERRIAGALQVDGRAPWKRIAEVLGEPERTVARYGTELLDSGDVVVAAVGHAKHQMILASRSAVGATRLTGEALAQRADVNYTYFTTGETDVVAEIGYDSDLSELLTLQLPATVGIGSFTAFPVLKYFKTIRGWRCGSLTEQEEAALSVPTGPDVTEWSLPEHRGPHDEEIIAALQEDGRVALEAVARRVKMSTSSVARRIEWLLRSAQLSIRALVEPAALGLEVEALLWVQARPDNVDELGEQLRRWPAVRYAAALAGTYQLLVNVTVTSHAKLYEVLAHPIWARRANLVRTDFLVEARKRGGRAIQHA